MALAGDGFRHPSPNERQRPAPGRPYHGHFDIKMLDFVGDFVKFIRYLQDGSLVLQRLAGDQRAKFANFFEDFIGA